MQTILFRVLGVNLDHEEFYTGPTVSSENLIPLYVKRQTKERKGLQLNRGCAENQLIMQLSELKVEVNVSESDR